MIKKIFLLALILFLGLSISNAQTIQTYNTGGSNTWTCPVGVTSVTVECFGAGGCGSARTNSGQNGGGGGGAYASSVIAVTAGTNYNVTVGAGGTSAGTNNGGNSSFNTVSVVAAGGTGLANGVATGAAGGLASASTGTIKFNGGTGGNSGGGNSGAGGGGAGSGGAGSNGVGSVAGAAVADNIGGTGGTGVNGNSVGDDGNSYGGGGSGGSRSSNGNRNGGSGADGAVVLTYCLPLTITGQPASVAGLCSGSNTSFNVGVTGSPTMSYQWQRDPNTGTFTNITSAAFDAGVTYSNYTSATLNLTGATSALNNYKYRCVITTNAPCSQTVTTNGLATITFIVVAPLNGTYTIGGAGSPSYASLTAAFAAMSCGGLSGNVNLVLQSGYVSTVETFPLATYPNATSYSITIYPAVSGLSITSANTNETINFDGADNYIIDGRVNQAGAMNLIVENTTTNGVAIQLINDASYNTIKYCNIKGSNTNVVEGIVLLSTALSTGNDYNTIDHCDIHESVTGTPYDCINSTGTTGSENDHNTVSNCNIYNFYIDGNLPSGIDIEGGNTDWTITGNSFYQTATRTPGSNSGLYPIYIVSTGNNYVVSNNYLGGTAPNCGGTALTFNSGATVQGIYAGIYIQTGTTTACIVQNNTVSNILLGDNQSSGNTSFYGVAVGAGYVNVSNNTIGATTGTGSITLIYSTTGVAFTAEGITTSAVQGNVSNNIIGSITASGGKINQGGLISLIDCAGALTSDFIVSNNVIGSTTTANSIQYSGGSANPVNIFGIHIGTTGAVNVTTSGNIIQNITNTTTGAGAMYGIDNNSSSLVSVTSNTIANITTAAPAIRALIGVYHANTTAGQTISYNVIHDLSNTTAGATTDDVYGVYYSGPTTGANSINGNTIYNLLLSSTSTSANIYGLYINSGLATTSNNMIDLGVGVGTGYGIFGIYQNSATANNHHYFNSVYIGGTAASGAINTNAFYSATATHTIENNIFYNNRTGGTGKHYAIDVVTKAGVTSNYNDLLSSVAANLGSVNGGGAVQTFATWKAAAPAGDANSINSDPLFAGQTSSPANLHLSSGSPCGLAALTTTIVTTDIDLEPRSTTPDIGADEYHTNYYSKSAGNLELTTSWGTNTDGSGANPPNFTTRDCVFNIRNNATPTIGAAWTVSGSGDVVVLGDGTTACNFTIPGAAVAFTGTINISNNGTLTNQNTANPTFNNINANSTVNYNAASTITQTVATAAYGNLILSNMTGSGVSTKTVTATGITIAGDLTINGFAVFDIATFNANRTGGGGTLTVLANGTLKLSGNSGGASTTNNFPDNFSTMSLASASTVEYYSATAQNIYPSVTYGNLTTTSGIKTAGGALTIAGNLTINSGSTFAGSTYTHILQGDFLNSGTFTANTSTMNFNNTNNVLQHIGPAAGSITTFATLKINNKANVTMLQDANVNTALTLTSGLLNTSASGSGLLIMLNGSTAPALTSASTTYVNGPMQYQKTGASTSTLNFPIGTSPDCRPVMLTVNHTNGTQYNYTAQLHNSNPWVDMLSTVTDMPSTVDTISGVHYWTIDRTSTIGGVVASAPSAGLGYSAGVYPLIQLNFGTNDGVYQGGNLTIVKNTSAATATWIDIGATCALGNSSTPQAGSVTSTTSGTPFNSFSSFTLGSKNTGWNPLPIELLSFTAVANGDKVDVKWETVTETNNAYFTIEKSKDGKTFTKLIDVPGAGNSTTYRDYAETDYQPYEGTSYYRLKQTDANGAYKYFTMVPVTFVKGGQQHIVVYPNPINNATNLNIELDGYKNQEVVVVLRDIQGKEFLSKVLFTEEDGHVFIVDETKTLTPGTYIITASSNDKIYNYKLIVR